MEILSLSSLLDVVGELFSDEISIAVSNTEEYLYYRPSKRVDLKIVIVTEQGYASLRDLAPRERVELIIENYANPMYREQLREYYQEALERGGQTPHVL